MIKLTIWGGGMKVLAGDIGGTKTELAIFDVDQPTVPLFSACFLNREQDEFIPMLLNYMHEPDVPIQAACFAVAGAV